MHKRTLLLLLTLAAVACSSIVTMAVTGTTYDARGNASEESTAMSNDFDPEVDRVSTVHFAYSQNGRLASNRETIVDYVTTASPLKLAILHEYEYDDRGDLIS
jgi:hypothetical protein